MVPLEAQIPGVRCPRSGRPATLAKLRQALSSSEKHSLKTHGRKPSKKSGINVHTHVNMLTHTIDIAHIIQAKPRSEI